MFTGCLRGVDTQVSVILEGVFPFEGVSGAVSVIVRSATTQEIVGVAQRDATKVDSVVLGGVVLYDRLRVFLSSAALGVKHTDLGECGVELAPFSFEASITAFIGGTQTCSSKSGCIATKLETVFANLLVAPKAVRPGDIVTVSLPVVDGVSATDLQLDFMLLRGYNTTTARSTCRAAPASEAHFIPSLTPSFFLGGKMAQNLDQVCVLRPSTFGAGLVLGAKHISNPVYNV